MADPNKINKLQQLSAQLPVANARVQQQQQSARDLQLQQAVQKAPTATPVQATAAQIGQAQVASAGQQAIEAAKGQLQAQGQIAQQAIAVQKMGAQNNIATAQRATEQQRMDIEGSLAQVSLEAKRELYDDTMQFRRDQQGRALFNQGQLDDFKLSTVQNEQAWKTYSGQVEMLYDRKAALTKVKLDKAKQEMTQQAQLRNQLLDNLQSTRLSERERQASLEALRKLADNERMLKKLYADKAIEYNEAAAKKANRAAKDRAIWGTASGIVLGGTALVLSGGNPAVGLAAYKTGETLGGGISDLT
jgi:hypothetical protein